MNKYEKYKKVDLSWINNIPSSWRILKVNSIFEERREKVSDKEYEPLSVTKMGVLKQLENVAKTNSGDNRKKVLKNDFVINSRSDRKGSSGLSEYNGSVSLINIVLLIKNEYPKYLHYLLKSVLFQEEFYRNGKGIVADLWSTNYQSMKNIYLPIPPFSEQENIANFLDWKIREIDKLIEIEKQQIEDIERLKKIMISQYYIKLPIKRRIKTLIQSPLVYGINEAGKMNGKIRFVRITDIEKNGSLKKDGKQYINDCEKKYILEKGDVLFARSGGTVGKTYIHQDISNNELMAFAGYLIRARFDVNLVNPEYIYYYTQSESYTEWKNSIFIQSTIQNISAEKYSNLEIPYCSLNIQNKIVDKIKQKLLEINKLKEKSLEKQLYLVSLKESIISEVVTGQIDVRNVKIPERK